MIRPLVMLPLASFLLIPPPATAQVPRGPEFQVNTYTTGNQADPAVAADGAGNFVVVWQSYSWDASARGIFARRYDRAGTPLGPGPFRVNTYNEGIQSRPRVASTPDGRLVVVWQSYGQDGSQYGIFGQRFDAAGAPAGTEFRVNSYTTGAQRQPDVVADGTGRFVVVWSSLGQDGSDSGVFAQRYDADGLPQGGEFRVNGYTTGGQASPAVAGSGAGEFVVVWSALAEDGSGAQAILGRRFDADGLPQGEDFQVSSYATGAHADPAVAADAAGAFVVAWTSSGQDGNSDGVFGQRYDPAGLALGTEFRVNTHTIDWQRVPAVAADPGGAFVVAWTSYGQDGSGWGVFGQRYDAGGLPDAGEFPLNSYTLGLQGRPAVAAGPAGEFVAVWPSDGQDGSGYGVFGRRFASDLIFRDGFEGGTLAAWSRTSDGSGDLRASPAAALDATSVGLEAVVNDTGPLCVEDDTPRDEDRYRARFYLDPNGFDPGEAQGHLRTRLFIALAENPTRRLATVVLRRQAGAYSIMGRCRRDDDTHADTGFVPIADAPHAIELDWERASADGAHDGRCEVWLDGVSVGMLTALDNRRGTVESARLGALSVKTGAAGTIFWDEFESRRASYIGP